MKKVLLALMLVAGMVIPALAQDKAAEKPIWDRGDNVSDMTYQTVVVDRVYDSIDSYIVFYQKQGYELGKVAIPKSWANLGTNHKLFFRNKVKTLSNSMTVFYKNNEFYKVVLTLPVDKADHVWAVAPNDVVSGVSQDATTLDIAY